MIDVEAAKGFPPGWFVLTVQGEPLFAATCIHACHRAARIVSEARVAPYRDAMRMLTVDLGLCEEVAASLLFKVQDQPSSQRAVN